MSVVTVIVETAGDLVRVQVAGDLAACDCDAPPGGLHAADCGCVVAFEPMQPQRWPYWFRRTRYRRPVGRTRR